LGIPHATNTTTPRPKAKQEIPLSLSTFLPHFHPPSSRQRPPAPRSLSPLWMATAPNIEMIASSLRSCSLNGGGRRPGRRHRHGHARGAEGSNDSEGVTVELNSDVALPYHWQQCLDIRVRTRPHLYIPSFVPLHNIRIGGIDGRAPPCACVHGRVRSPNHLDINDKRLTR
uniref:Uncharacterized protein n=1 Tax=Aegilops tauschii subsp. strangulata TaxID=200361 RepID=A0A453NVA0_AEGTS